MRILRSAAAVLILLSPFTRSHAQSKTIAERLGYPADSKLLIIHADDLAVAHSEDIASFDALDKGAATSASIMIPCPWLTEVADYAKSHPDADLGLHLTLTSEWKTYRWGSVLPKDRVPSLYDPTGYLFFDAAPFLQSVKADDVEREIRAQVERAIAMGIHPTHLDSHMGMLFLRPDYFAAYVKVAHEYRRHFWLPSNSKNTARDEGSALSERCDPRCGRHCQPIHSTQRMGTKSFYFDTIKNLKPGLTELIIHLGTTTPKCRRSSRSRRLRRGLASARLRRNHQPRIQEAPAG